MSAFKTTLNSLNNAPADPAASKTPAIPRGFRIA